MTSKNKKSRLILSVLIIAIVNLYLVSLPLTNLIGYEFSAINGIILSFVGGLYSLSIFKKDENYLSSLSGSWGEILLILFIPFVIGFANHALFEICPFTKDIFFYFLITIPAFFISTFLAYWIKNIFNKFTILIFILIYLHFIFIPIWEIYRNPQVYFYNPLIVFFPGNIYDEDITITMRMLTYRVITILIYSIFVMTINLTKKYSITKLFRVVPLLIIFIFIYLKPILGFATDNVRMESHLSSIYETENFRLCFSPEIPDDVQKNIILMHEFHFRDINSKYGFNEKGKITSYIFENGDEKRELFGAKNADMAKPWLRSIYVNADNYLSTLRHEIAHIFSERFGVTPFKVAAWFNPALIEGFAMALENNYNDNTNHYLAWLAEEAGYPAELKKLFSGQNFFTNASSLSYILSGSFVQYLMEKEGTEKFEKVYAGDSFEDVYGQPITKLETEYRSYLDSLGFDFNQSVAKTYFAHKALIQKVCPRYTANRLKEAFNLYEKESYMASLRVFREIFDYSKSYTALVGLCSSYIKLYETENAIAELKKYILFYEKTAYYNNLLLRLGDYSVLINNYKQASTYYKLLSEENPVMVYRNNVILRRKLLSDEEELKDYVEGKEEDRYKIVINLLKEKTDYNILPIAAALCPEKEKDYKLFIDNFVHKVEIDSGSAFYAVLQLGKLALENSDYENAKYFFSRIINYPDNNGNTEIMNQYCALAAWLSENNSKIEMKKITSR